MLRMEGKKRLQILNQLSEIIREEIALDKKLLLLCKNDSRLGFHSEAEGYKYFPEKISWRMNQLSAVLAFDVPEFERIIRRGDALFPEYTGRKPVGPQARCISVGSSVEADDGKLNFRDMQWQTFGNEGEAQTLRWAACYDREALYIIVSGSETADRSVSVPPISALTVKVEPRRLWPCKRFMFSPENEGRPGDEVRIFRESGTYYITVRIPFEKIGQDVTHVQPVRIDVQVQKRKGGVSAWLPSNPLTPPVDAWG